MDTTTNMDEGSGEEVAGEGVEEDSGVLGTPASGESRYRRIGKAESFDDWLRRKEKKPVKPTSTGLKRRVGLSSSGPLNPVSKKQKKKNQEYEKAKKTFYKEEKNQVCFLCGSPNNLSIHHIAKRGNEIANQKKFVTLCLIGSSYSKQFPHLNQTESCHDFVEKNKGWARANHLLE